MTEDIKLYEIMLELAEEENKDLKNENDVLYGYAQYLKAQNEDLKRQIENLLDIRKRRN